MLTSYVRGNISDAVSLNGRIGYSFYDADNTGTIELFDDYDNEDLLSAKFEATLWTPSRSRISLAAEYQGGATARDGIEALGLSNRIANLYGGSLAGVYSIDKTTYISLVTRYLRGEVDETNNGINYSSREKYNTVAFSVGSKL
jgi:hypothetical protein